MESPVQRQILSMLSALSGIHKHISNNDWEKALDYAIVLRLGAETLTTMIKQSAKGTCLTCKERGYKHGTKIQERPGD